MPNARYDATPCPVPRWLADKHSQTVWAAFIAAHHRIAFVRERVDTPDGDFIDFDWSGPGLFPHKTAQGTLLSERTPVADGKTAAARWITDADWLS